MSEFGMVNLISPLGYRSRYFASTSLGIDISSPRDSIVWLDVIAIFCLAALPDLVRSLMVASNSSFDVTYTFTQLLILLIARSLQVSLPILLVMRLRNVSWTDYGFVSFRLWRDSLTAVGLTLMCYFAYYAGAALLYYFGFDFSGDFDAIPNMTTEASLSLGTISLILMASAANGFAEELGSVPEIVRS